MFEKEEANRVLLTLLTKHHPKVTLEERLRWATLLADSFEKALGSTQGYEVDRKSSRMAFTSLPKSSTQEHVLTLNGVGSVKIRVNHDTAAIEMASVNGTEWKAARVELDWIGRTLVGSDIDPDIVPRRGRRLPRKDAMQVLAELFAELVELPEARPK